jgi:hypothetical protein
VAVPGPGLPSPHPFPGQNLAEFIEAALGPEYKEDVATVVATLLNKPFRVKSVKALSALSEDDWAKFASEEGAAVASLLKAAFAASSQGIPLAPCPLPVPRLCLCLCLCLLYIYTTLLNSFPTVLSITTYTLRTADAV